MIYSPYCTNESVNQLLSYSKAVVESISDNTMLNRYDKAMKVLIFAGLLSYYGFEYIDEITRTFKENKFIFLPGSIHEYILQQSGISRQSLDGVLYDDSCALFWKRYLNNGSIVSNGGKLLIANRKDVSPDLILENTVHETNHAITSIKNYLVKNASDQYFLRMGIRLTEISSKSRTNKIVEEAINVLQSAEITEHILSFSNYEISDKDIKYVLDSMRYAADVKREGHGYCKVTPLIRPLYEDTIFNRELKKRRLDGYIGNINTIFDKKAGQNSFALLSKTCDEIYDDSVSSSAISQKQNNIKKLVKSYTN